jgi:hypothetical protein
MLDLSEKPGFKGSLLLQATGWVEAGEYDAFILRASVDVR